METNLKFQAQDVLELPKFKTALEYRNRLTFGIGKLDSILDLHVEDMIGIFGETRYTNALVTRLIVRSLMPHIHGGFDTEKVIVIDLDNSFNLHLSVDFARYYGLDLNRVFENILVSRHFKNYQLINAIHYELPKRVQIHKPKVIVISGLVDQFLQEPNINIDEFENLTIQIVAALHKIKDVLIILTSRFGDNKMEFPALPRIIEIRAKKELDETKLNLSIYYYGRLKRISMMEADITN
jgi:Rad51 protein